MVGGEAVRAVERDRRRDARLVEAQGVENRLGQDHLVARPGGLEVQDAAERAGKVAVPRRLQAAAVQARPLPRDGIRDRDHDAAAQELPAFRRDDAQGEELRADVALLRDDLEERAVGVAHLQGTEEIHVGEAALPKIGLRVLPLAEGPVVVLDHASEHRG